MEKEQFTYELITNYDSLDIAPDKEFFETHQFYSSMKESVFSTEKCENVKKFCTLMKLSNVGVLNQIYNFQDTIILCEIFE